MASAQRVLGKWLRCWFYWKIFYVYYDDYPNCWEPFFPPFFMFAARSALGVLCWVLIGFAAKKLVHCLNEEPMSKCPGLSVLIQRNDIRGRVERIFYLLFRVFKPLKVVNMSLISILRLQYWSWVGITDYIRGIHGATAHIWVRVFRQ